MTVGEEAKQPKRAPLRPPAAQHDDIGKRHAGTSTPSLVSALKAGERFSGGLFCFFFREAPCAKPHDLYAQTAPAPPPDAIIGELRARIACARAAWPRHALGHASPSARASANNTDALRASSLCVRQHDITAMRPRRAPRRTTLRHRRAEQHALLATRNRRRSRR